MKRRQCIRYLLVGGASTFLGVIAFAAPLTQADLEGATRQRLGAEQGPVCVAVAVVSSRDAPLYYTRCEQGGAPAAEHVDADSIFEIGSISKVFTATLIQEAVARHTMRLDAPVSEYLVPNPATQAVNATITIANLLTHTSGLPRLPRDVPLRPVDPYALVHGADIEDAFAVTRLNAAPGTQFGYSNFGFMVLSHALGHSGHRNFAALLQEQVTQPLGMTSTYVHNATLDARRIAGHDDQTHLGARWEFDDDLAGVGGIKSSLADMTRFARANLVAETGARDDALSQALHAAHQSLFHEGALNIASAWFIEDGPGGPITFHSGGTGGYRSFIGFSAHEDRAVVVLVNSESEMTDLGMHLLDASRPMQRAHAAADLGAVDLADYTGDYQLTPQLVLSISGGNHRLFARATGQSEFEVFGDAPDNFYFTAIVATMHFNRDANGKVTTLSFQQGGATTVAPRLSRTPVVDLAPGELTPYVGRYAQADGSLPFVVTQQDAGLFVRFADQPALEVFRRGDDVFAYRAVDAQITFTRTPDHRVSGLTLSQNGQLLKAQRAP